MVNYDVSVKLNKRKSVTGRQVIFHSCLIVSILSVVYLLFTFTSEESTLSLIQCVLGIAALYIPMLVTKFTGIKLPETLCSFFYIFILCATVLGEVFALYYAVPIWDSLLHFGSGIMAGMFGGILMVNYFQKKKCVNLISPMFIAVSIVCFAVSIGAVWEIYEFTADSLLGLNMQKFMIQDGTELIGQTALTDTMKDIIIDIAGAITAAVSSYSSLKQKKGWLYKYNSF